MLSVTAGRVAGRLLRALDQQHVLEVPDPLVLRSKLALECDEKRALVLESQDLVPMVLIMDFRYEFVQHVDSDLN